MAIYLQRICICAAPGCGENGNDNGKWQSTSESLPCPPRPGAAHIAMTVAHGNLPDIMLQRVASAPAQMAMTMANGNPPQRICICAAPGRGANGNDNGKWQSTSGNLL
eukprot:4283790-Karenia_brevis.AAC.1